MYWTDSLTAPLGCSWRDILIIIMRIAILIIIIIIIMRIAILIIIMIIMIIAILIMIIMVSEQPVKIGRRLTP